MSLGPTMSIPAFGSSADMADSLPQLGWNEMSMIHPDALDQVQDPQPASDQPEGMLQPHLLFRIILRGDSHDQMLEQSGGMHESSRRGEAEEPKSGLLHPTSQEPKPMVSLNEQLPTEQAARGIKASQCHQRVDCKQRTVATGSSLRLKYASSLAKSIGGKVAVRQSPMHDVWVIECAIPLRPDYRAIQSMSFESVHRLSNRTASLWASRRK